MIMTAFVKCKRGVLRLFLPKKKVRVIIQSVRLSHEKGKITMKSTLVFLIAFLNDEVTYMITNTLSEVFHLFIKKTTVSLRTQHLTQLQPNMDLQDPTIIRIGDESRLTHTSTTYNQV